PGWQTAAGGNRTRLHCQNRDACPDAKPKGLPSYGARPQDRRGDAGAVLSCAKLLRRVALTSRSAQLSERRLANLSGDARGEAAVRQFRRTTSRSAKSFRERCEGRNALDEPFSNQPRRNRDWWLERQLRLAHRRSARRARRGQGGADGEVRI